MFENCYTLIRKTINAPDFIARHRRSETDFTRHRKLSFPLLMLYFLNLVKGSAQQELDSFFKVVNQTEDPTQFITQSAFTQARQKLSPMAFYELNTSVTDHFYRHATIKKIRVRD